MIELGVHIPPMTPYTQTSMSDPTTPSSSIEYKRSPWGSGAVSSRQKDTVFMKERRRVTSHEGRFFAEALPTCSPPAYNQSMAAAPEQVSKAWRGTRRQTLAHKN